MSLEVLGACSAALWCWRRSVLVNDLLQTLHSYLLTRVFGCIGRSPS